MPGVTLSELRTLKIKEVRFHSKCYIAKIIKT